MGSPPAELITMHLLVLTLLCLTSATLALVHYPNGAAVPYNGALIAATNAHLVSKGYLGYHPGYYLGRKKREADAQVYPLAYGYPTPCPMLSLSPPLWPTPTVPWSLWSLRMWSRPELTILLLMLLLEERREKLTPLSTTLMELQFRTTEL